MIRNILLAAAGASTLALGAGIAQASDDDFRRMQGSAADRADWISIADLATRIEAKGYRIREIEIEHGVYDVEMIDANGMRVEGYFDPVTGDQVRRYGYDD
ncbi:MAG: PepSY domain-containing protein [Pseudomonadota bacterium]|uniref:PepSY domain-containing protein n=1 Tax=Roseovarius TaxID=74030 RepID=UPI0022A8BB2A|nr:PepSY domain-containing protein [Roseovarius sp. EGI FJ00037]MCZ0812926.1 PepSY domain-containing protein [Roseovarius sp. EGI FJ00037]